MWWTCHVRRATCVHGWEVGVVDVSVLGDPHLRIGGHERAFPAGRLGRLLASLLLAWVGSSATTGSSTTCGAGTSPSMRAPPCTPPSVGPGARSAPRARASGALRSDTG